MFYTYLWLREDGTPYYVGKGKGRRAYHQGKRHRAPEQSRIFIQHWADEETAFAMEIWYIKFWGRKDLGTGCLRNNSDGGEGTSGHKMSAEQKQRLSEALKGNTNGNGNTGNVGRKASKEARLHQSLAKLGHAVSEETRRKIGKASGAARKGIIFTEKHRQNLSKALKGRPSPTLGMKFSEETRLKMRLAHAKK